ncbi:hypothetical protein JR334_01860 [Clostridia bacterium]|nr:hypothetical protein JR334_01860 [Clostridia bacterium]
MTEYYTNTNKDKYGRYEIHTATCSYLPKPENRALIGLASDCHDAIRKAKAKWPGNEFDGCYYCSRPCHKG